MHFLRRSLGRLTSSSADQPSRCASQLASKAPPSTAEQRGRRRDAQGAAAEGAARTRSTCAVTKSASFGDAFDEPQIAEDAPLPAAFRPRAVVRRKADAAAADASRATVRTEPKLTQKMISQWALTNARMEMVSKPVKAPRFVSQTLRAQPTAVYAEGFNVKTASVDPARFSGTAVNFMEVRKFNTN